MYAIFYTYINGKSDPGEGKKDPSGQVTTALRQLSHEGRFIRLDRLTCRLIRFDDSMIEEMPHAPRWPKHAPASFKLITHSLNHRMPHFLEPNRKDEVLSCPRCHDGRFGRGLCSFVAVRRQTIVGYADEVRLTTRGNFVGPHVAVNRQWNAVAQNHIGGRCMHPLAGSVFGAIECTIRARTKCW